MNKLYKMIVILAVMFTVTNIYAQSAYVTWPLSSTTTISPSTPVGNIQATNQTIGTSNPQMTVNLPYTTDGQRLYFPNTGWPASPVDYTRYIQHEVAPLSGNSFNVQYVSFNYGDNPLPTNFNIIESEVWYSLDNWNTKVQLNTTPLSYLNSSMQTFSKSLSVVVASGQTFSLRIFPYSPNGGIAMTPSFAIHNTVLIEGTTSESSTSICTDFEDGNGGWTTNNAQGTIIEEGDNHYFQTTDQSGASSFYNESKPLTGDWAAFLDGGCGTLCWDVNYLFAGNGNDGSSQPITITPGIRIEGNGFSAYFVTNDLITAGDGWHSYCAPLSILNPGESLPANSEGHWVMSVGTDSDWNSMLSNITMLRLSIDPTSYQAERFGFDNFCLTNTDDCGSIPDLCESLGAEAIKTSPDDCDWSLNLIQPNDLTGITSIQILCLLPNQFTTGTGLGTNYQDWFTSGSNTFTPPNGIVPGGNLNDFFNMSLSFVTSPQIVIVNWLDESGEIVCSETIELDCEISCTSILSDTVTCNGSDYTYSYSFTNNADYGISSIEYTLQSPGNVTISPLTTNLSWAVSPGSNSILQNIQILGAFPGDTVSILAKFNSPDGCCWCYETITAIMPSCITVCDSLSVEAQGNPDDCCYSISLTNISSMEFSHVEFELVSGGMFSAFSTSATGWGFTNAWPNNLIKLRKFPPFTETIGQGTFPDVLDMCIRDYTSPNQVVAVRWMNNGEVVCTDTLMFECTPLDLPIDSCSQANNGTLTCLPDGTFLYKFRVQNNSTIMSTGYGIYPTTPGVTFSKTLFENINILPGQVSPLDSIIISGIGGGEELCFQTAIFNTVVPGESVYNFCCHSDIFCITTPECGEPTGCVDPPSGMVAWWTLDEISGTSSLDLASFDNMGTHMNNPFPVAAKVLGGLQFSGKNFVDVPHQSELNFGTGDFSFDAWIQTSNDVGVQHLVDKRVKNSGGIFGYLFYLVDGKLSLRLEDGTATDYVSPVFVADGMFHHIAITVSRNDQNGITFYLDGEPTSFGDPTTHQGSLDNRGILRIGAQSFVENYSFRGILDEIELFNRAITKDEVNSIYEAGSNGKCKTTTDINDEQQIPKKIELMQSYPNPFNPSTTIRYNLSKAGFVKLTVYDILGREVKVLVNEDQNPGQHNITFNADNLASGIYIYTLRTGDFYQSKKMILMK